jgi:hypothetical protein
MADASKTFQIGDVVRTPRGLYALVSGFSRGRERVNLSYQSGGDSERDGVTLPAFALVLVSRARDG